MLKDQAPTIEIQTGLLVRNTILNLIGVSIPLAIGVVSIPFIIRWLGIERFGILTIAWSFFGYFIIFDFGLARATTKFIAEALGEQKIKKIPQFLWTTVIFQGILGLLGSILTVAAIPLLIEKLLNIPVQYVDEARLTFYFLALSFPVILLSGSFRGAILAAQRFDLINAVNVPTSVTNYLMPFLGALLGFSLPGIILMLLASRIIILFVWFLLCLKLFPILKTRFSFHKESIHSLLGFGGWITISNVIGPFLVYFDRFLIGTLLTLEAVSYYTAPQEALMRLGFLPGSLLLTLFPAFSTLKGSKDSTKIRSFFTYSVKYILIAMGLIIIILVYCAKIVLTLWLGENFAQNSTVAFQILALGSLVITLAGVPVSLLHGIGRADITAKLRLFEICFYVPLAWLLIREWGINGVAAAWTIRVSVAMILLFISSYKFGRIGFFSLVENGVIRACVLLSIFTLTSFFTFQFSWKYYGLLVLICAFLLATWFYVLNKFEKTWIKEKIQTIFEKRLFQ